MSVLRVLGAVLASDGYTHHNRHLEYVAAHGLPFRELVEDFVAAAAEEVAVHNLGNHAAAAHRISDGGADDGRLGDGAVEQTVVGESLGKPAVHGEGAAPFAVLFAIGDEAG